MACLRFVHPEPAVDRIPQNVLAYADAMQLTPQSTRSNGLCPITVAFLAILVRFLDTLLLLGGLVAKRHPEF
jgi:hypothetical protein